METLDTSTGASARPRPLQQTAIATLVVLLVLLGFALLLSLRNVLVSVFLGLLLATAMRPIMGRLREGRLPRFVAASGSLLVLIGLVGGFLMLVAPVIVEQVETLTTAAPGLYAGARQWLLESHLALFRQIGQGLAPQLVLGRPAAELSWPQLLPTVTAVGYLSFVTVCTFVFAYYWLLYRERSVRGLLLLLPMERREGAERLWVEIEGRLGDYLRGQFILALVVGVLSLVGYWLAGLPFALLLALIAGVLELVPFIGPFIAVGVAIAVGLSEGPQIAIAALVVGLLVQQFENNILAPRVMDETVGISPVVTLLAFVGFGALFGPFGALLAIPLAAALQVLFAAWLDRNPAPEEAAPAGRGLVDRLRYDTRVLAADIAGHLRQKESAVQAENDAPEEALEQILQELEALLAGDEAPSGVALGGQALEAGR